MDPQTRRVLSSRGGKAAHDDRPTAFKAGEARARRLGRKGGKKNKREDP